DGRLIEVAPLEGLEEIEIDGTLYEAFNTSGGLGSLAETQGAHLESMNYKTIRYPGHCEQMRLLMNDLKLNHDRGTLKRILENAVPQTLQDVVIVYAAVTGTQDGELREENYVNKIYPQLIGGRLWSAIQVTTAAGVTAVLDLVLAHKGRYSGFVAQEQFRLTDILANRFGRYYAPGGGGRRRGGWARGAGCEARWAGAPARRAGAGSQARPRQAGVAREWQDSRRGARRGSGDDRHRRLRRRPVAHALRTQHALRAPEAPHVRAVAPARRRGCHLGLQLSGRGVVLECLPRGH